MARKKTAATPPCDFMAIGAHADDAEIYAGGTLAKLVSLGRKGVIVDMTDASAGTRGTPELRLREAMAAAKSLGVARENLGLPDGHLVDSLDAQFALAALLRRYRPRVLLTHAAGEEHPDHEATHAIVTGASFRAGLVRLSLAGEAWRPQRIFHWVGLEPPAASFAVDISDFWRQKMAAIACYASQFHSASAHKVLGKNAKPTDLATPAFLEALEYRARYFGARIKRRYAEAFTCRELPEIHDLTALGGSRFP